MKKSNKKGFTLVELVVVIAIIGILAAILVPTMMNYVKKAKLKSANSNAKLVFTTVNGKLADLVVDGETMGSGAATISADVASLSVASPTGASQILSNSIYEALKDNGDGAGSVYVNINNDEVKWAQWADQASSPIVGQYPNPETDPSETNTLGTQIS